MGLIFVDCEAYGNAPEVGQLTEFGMVDYDTFDTFHGIIIPSKPSKENPAIPERTTLNSAAIDRVSKEVYENCYKWLLLHKSKGSWVFVSDNVAFDWQWINHGFWKYFGSNPFGHSGRRIGDFYAGLQNDFHATQKWKRLRKTKHDHNPVHDALGNAEAFKRIMKGER